MISGHGTYASANFWITAPHIDFHPSIHLQFNLFAVRLPRVIRGTPEKNGTGSMQREEKGRDDDEDNGDEVSGLGEEEEGYGSKEGASNSMSTRREGPREHGKKERGKSRAPLAAHGLGGLGNHDYNTAMHYLFSKYCPVCRHKPLDEDGNSDHRNNDDGTGDGEHRKRKVDDGDDIHPSAYCIYSLCAAHSFPGGADPYQFRAAGPTPAPSQHDPPRKTKTRKERGEVHKTKGEERREKQL